MTAEQRSDGPANVGPAHDDPAHDEPAPEEVDPEHGTKPDGAPVENPSG